MLQVYVGHTIRPQGFGGLGSLDGFGCVLGRVEVSVGKLVFLEVVRNGSGSWRGGVSDY